MKSKPLPSQEELRELFDYKEGELFWKVSPANRVKVGDKAGIVNKNGYVVLSIKNRLYHAHRVIWKMFKGVDPSDNIDHINRNKSDNRIENLRELSNHHNALNNSAKGYTYLTDRGKYQAQIRVAGKRITLGYFDTPEEASSRYQEFKELYMEMVNA